MEFKPYWIDRQKVLAIGFQSLIGIKWNLNSGATSFPVQIALVSFQSLIGIKWNLNQMGRTVTLLNNTFQSLIGIKWNLNFW